MFSFLAFHLYFQTVWMVFMKEPKLQTQHFTHTGCFIHLFFILRMENVVNCPSCFIRPAKQFCMKAAPVHKESILCSHPHINVFNQNCFSEGRKIHELWLSGRMSAVLVGIAKINKRKNTPQAYSGVTSLVSCLCHWKPSWKSRSKTKPANAPKQNLFLFLKMQSERDKAQEMLHPPPPGAVKRVLLGLPQKGWVITTRSGFSNHPTMLCNTFFPPKASRQL